MSARAYKQYPAYKDSGVEWPGEIPEGWEVKRLRFVSESNPLPSEVRSLPADTEVSFVPMEAIGEHGGLTLETTKLLADVKAGYTFFRDGDVVIAKITPCFENGKGALAAGLINGIAFGTTELHVLRSGKRADRRFAFYVTLSDAFRKLGEADMYGAGGQKRISESFVRDFPLALPSVDDQRVISDFLDRETVRIDALVTRKERLIELLQERRTALITRAVTKGLNPAMPMKDSGVEWLGEIPAHWDVRSLKSVASIRYGLGEPPRLLADGLPFIRATNVAKGRIVEKDLQFVDPEDVPWRRAPRLRTGDIIVVRSGAYTGDSAIIPHDYEGAVAGYDMVVRGRIGHSGFLAWTLLSRYVLESQIEIASLRAAQPHLNAEELGSVRVLYPPAAEQRTIANFLDCETARIDVLIASIHAAITRLHELRIALISAAVTGKIDVREAAQ